MDKIQVLVVEDASFVRDMIKNGLRSVFPAFRIDEAWNGRQAQTKLEKKKYDIVLCDWEMPEMTGAELLEWIRQTPEIENTPFVMVTSRGDKEHVAKAIELKANNFVVKPFTNEKLVNVVGKVLSKGLGVSPSDLMALGTSGADTGRGGSAGMLTQQGKAKDGNANLGLSGAIPVKVLPSQTPERVKVVRPKQKTVLAVRFSDKALACLVKQISRERIVAVFRRGDKMPGILDLVVVDLETQGQVSRLNGYIHSLEARDNSRETEFVNITIALIDQDDNEKMENLAHYIASLN